MYSTGNWAEEDIISGAVARYSSLGIYVAIRKNREQDKRKGRAETRWAKLSKCEWVACWRVLRTSDNLSGAENTAEDLSGYQDDSLGEDADSGSTSSPSPRNESYQRRPCGIKAAKLMRSEDAGMEMQFKASTAAVDKLTAAQRKRTSLCFLESHERRHTPEAAKYRKSGKQKMMESAGLAAAPGSASSPEPEKTEPVEDIVVIEVDDHVAALDVIPADATSSARPAAGSAAGANSPPAEDPPAASVAVDTTAAATSVADKLATPAAPETKRDGGGGNQRGRKSQTSKQLAVSAALNKRLGTTRGLEHSSESEETTTTTTDAE